ncbi:AAA family ATPase [Endozoicomonas sp. SM1973]|uniref:AAA family ATPase n=2 Tax=Spartinivicinus marinus TaxID=2994442 RepID=A0A853IHF3_9GAMM|nr:AAA family ATPase [Spartinivicinus marinus]
MIILVGGEKGGSGKSCLAQNLSVFLTQQEMDVLLVDADPQGTTNDWVHERNQNNDVRKIPCVQASGNIRETLLNLKDRYSAIVIDAGGQDSEAMRSAMLVSTHMLLPFRPKRRDLKTLDKMSKILRQAIALNPDLTARAVISQCPTLPTQAQRILDAKEACLSFEIQPLSSMTFTRNVYDDSDENGLSVLESKDAKARQEVINIATELLGDK